MSYLIFSCIILVFSFGYGRLKLNNKYSMKSTRLILWLMIFMLCLFAGLRTRYNDTYFYLTEYANTPTNLSEMFSGSFTLSEVYLFKFWRYFVYNFISTNVNVYFFLSSVVFVVPSMLLIDKYSKDFFFSMVLFMFAGMYLFSLAGLKQSMAIGVMLFALPFLFKKRYFLYYVFTFIAIGFHTYSVFFLILPLLGRKKIFNFSTIFTLVLILLVGLTLFRLDSVISAITRFLGKDVNEELLTKGSVNILRVLVFLVPLVFAIIGRKNLEANTSEQEKIFIKTSILSTMFMVLSMFGNPIFFGRVPQYFYIGTIVSLPLLFNSLFAGKDRGIAKSIATVCYVLFGIYSLYKDGAFSIDIFRLIWF